MKIGVHLRELEYGQTERQTDKPNSYIFLDYGEKC